MTHQSSFFYHLTKLFKQSTFPASDAAALPGSPVCCRAPSSWRSSPNRVLSIVLLSLIGVFLFSSSLTMAQTAGGSGVAATKQMQKEQRKADRKARRAKKNAELKKLDNSGYQPGWGNNADTQQSLQNAPRKAGPKSGAAAPASAP